MSIIFYLLISGAGFQGRVVDALTREPIPYVQLRLTSPGWEVFVSADSLGKWTLKGPNIPSSVTIYASHIGYKSNVWKDVSTKDTLTLFLYPRSIPVAGVTTTASRLKTTLEPPSPVTLIENSPVLTRGQIDISDLIEAAPGVMVNEYPNLNTISLRGATAEQTLIMLDGVRLNSSLNNQADLTLVAPFLANEIEVVRGGASPIYGANAIGGVINILTPKIEHFQPKASLGIGSFGKRYANFSISGPGRIDYLFTAGFMNAKNNFPYRDTLDSIRIRKNADLTRGNLLLKTLAAIGPHYFSLLTGFTIAERGSPGPLDFPSDSARLRDIQLLTALGYDIFESEKARLQVRISHQRTHQNYHNPDPYFTANDTHQVHQTSLNLNQWFEPIKLLTGNIGLESYYEEAKSTKVSSPYRWTNSACFEGNYQIREGERAFLSINPALRYDLLQQGRRSDSGWQRDRFYGALSPKLAFTLTPFAPSLEMPTPPLNLYFGIHRSFRAPTFNELYWPEDPWTKGNPTLSPEWATGIDGGLGGSIGETGLWRVNLFRSSLSNLIQWQPDTAHVWRPVNIAQARITGLELEGSLNLTRFGFSGNATYQRCQTERKDLPYRPRFSARTSIWLAYLKDDTLPLCRFVATGKGISSRYADEENSSALPGYFLLDGDFMVNIFKVLTSLSPELTALKSFNGWLVFGCRNILNRHYQTIKGYPVVGRNFYLEIETGL